MRSASVEIIRHSYLAHVVEDNLSDWTVVFFASHPSLPGICAHGASEQEAVKAFEESVDQFVALQKRLGLPVPQPTFQEFQITLTERSNLVKIAPEPAYVTFLSDGPQFARSH